VNRSAPLGDPTARRLAAEQFGLVTRTQLRAHGLSPHQLTNLIGPHGRWIELTDEVLKLHGSPDSAGQRTLAAVLDAGLGATLSYNSSGNWWGLHGCALEPVHVATTGSSRRRSTLATVHRVRFLPDRWTTVHLGVPTVRPELLALQLFAVSRFDRGERLVDRLWSLRLFSGASLARFLGDVPLRGVRGSAHLRRYFGRRGVDYRPPDSGLESRFDQITRAAGILFRRQVDIGDDAHWTGRVDFLHTVRPLVVEIQSEVHHSSLVDQAADRARLVALRAAGFTVVEITDTMVWTAPASVIAAVRAGLDAAGTH
jgi:very-short-patch-repair endonuclease